MIDFTTPPGSGMRTGRRHFRFLQEGPAQEVPRGWGTAVGADWSGNYPSTDIMRDRYPEVKDDRHHCRPHYRPCGGRSAASALLRLAPAFWPVPVRRAVDGPCQSAVKLPLSRRSPRRNNVLRIPRNLALSHRKLRRVVNGGNDEISFPRPSGNLRVRRDKCF